jgi:hypothetical protein
MRTLAFAFTVFNTGYILFVLVKPELFFELLDSLTWPWLAGDGVLRIGFGVALIGVASNARFTKLLQITGGWVIVGGIFMPIMGVEFIRDTVHSMYGQNIELLQGSMVFKLMFMGVLAYALMPPREDDAAPQGLTE